MQTLIRQTAIGAFVALSISARASLFLDDFAVGAPVVTATGSAGSNSGAWLGLEDGATRRISTTIGFNSQPGSAKARSSIRGAYELSNDPGVDAYGNLDYAFSAKDLRGATSVRVDFLSSTDGIFGLTLGDANTSAVIGFKGLSASASPFSVTFDIPKSASSDLDLAHLTDMGFFIDSGMGGMSRISKIQAVPEPACLIAFAVGLAGLKRRRSAGR